METRTITEYKVYLLFLNPMRERFESMDLVAFAESREALLNFMQSQKTAEPWYDESQETPNVYGSYNRWYKVFKQGGPLEWYNDIDRDNQLQERWVNEETLQHLSSHYLNASYFAG